MVIMSNEEMAAAAVTGGDKTVTATPPSPTPPTNRDGTTLGMTPPTPAGVAPVDDGPASDPLVFGAERAHADSLPPEGAGTEEAVTAPGSRPEAPTVSVSSGEPYSFTPNQNHPSSPDYVAPEPTTTPPP